MLIESEWRNKSDIPSSQVDQVDGGSFGDLLARTRF